MFIQYIGTHFKRRIATVMLIYKFILVGITKENRKKYPRQTNHYLCLFAMFSQLDMSSFTLIFGAAVVLKNKCFH